MSGRVLPTPGTAKAKAGNSPALPGDVYTANVSGIRYKDASRATDGLGTERATDSPTTRE